MTIRDKILERIVEDTGSKLKDFRQKFKAHTDSLKKAGFKKKYEGRTAGHESLGYHKDIGDRTIHVHLSADGNHNVVHKHKTSFGTVAQTTKGTDFKDHHGVDGMHKAIEAESKAKIKKSELE